MKSLFHDSNLRLKESSKSKFLHLSTKKVHLSAFLFTLFTVFVSVSTEYLAYSSGPVINLVPFS